MVTSNKLPEKKVVKMAEQNNTVVVPQRTLLGEVNEHLTCPLCRGYYIDATTIVECLHSFCRSCIIKHLQVKSYCPECEMMINSARPNIKPDKALQDIVYKLVPGLFQREMERRQQFYASRPGPAASATPEQRGEDTERIIFSPEDVISFSLEFADATDTDSISSKSSDSNEPQTALGTTRRFLQCPAVVNISHLKKFISMKFDIDSTQYSIDILYKRVPLPDYYTLMDIAYIYNWKRNEPMRFFYQITDYIAIRTRYGLFDINRKGSDFRDRKSSPTPTEETNVSSPAPNLTEQGSEVSSGTDSPMPDDNVKKATDSIKKHTKQEPVIKDPSSHEGTSSKNTNSSKKPDEDVEKSQFLNSFELTAKNSLLKPLTIKLNKDSINIKPDQDTKESTATVKAPANMPKTADDSLKRKHQTPTTSLEVKKLKVELDKTKPPANTSNTPANPVQTGPSMHTVGKKIESPEKKKEIQMPKALQPMSSSSASSVHSASTPSSLPIKETKPPHIVPKQVPDGTPIKRPVPGSHGISSPKRKTVDTTPSLIQSKPITPLKLQVPKTDSPTVNTKHFDTPRHTVKKMPDLKPSVPPSFVASQNKGQTIGKVRMDLLANNSDPTIDRSKILSQVKTSLGNQNPSQMSGDPLKSLFDSCKINIPSSLSITLTDQKDQRNQNDPSPVDPKKSMVNKNLSLAGTNNAAAHKVPSPPVHNYIEILKLPDADPKKQVIKPDNNAQTKPALPNKAENPASQSKPSSKTEPSAKGPIPSLKPIADTKSGKSNSGLSGPITFQQTFEQQIQSIQTTDKPKLPKNKMQIPKLMPATPKALSAANKLNSKPNTPIMPENKSALRADNALDLSTPHNIHSQLGLQQTKALETMQSIANLAKKQNLATKAMPQNSMFSGISNRPVPAASMPLRIPSITNSNTANQTKTDRVNNPGISHINNTRQDISNKLNTSKQITNMSSVSSPSYQMGSHNSPSTAQPSPRQTRSPSSSPKLVIAEEKQSSSMSEQIINQSNQISSTQLGSNSASKAEPSKPSPGPSKPIMKPIKTLIPSKMPAIRPPVGMNINNPTDFQLIQQSMLRQTMEMHAWLKAQHLNMSNQSSNNNDKH